MMTMRRYVIFRNMERARIAAQLRLAKIRKERAALILLVGMMGLGAICAALLVAVKP
jgi:hypothetical protein